VQNMTIILLIIVLAPLVGSILTGFFPKQLGRALSHRIAITGVATSFVLTLLVSKWVFIDKLTLNENVYTWASSGALKVFAFHIGFLLDPLSVIMMIMVSFVSLLVHIYTIAYMSDDAGYQRFFSYISLFTFFMLMLVSANNFLQLFFGWEGVGLVSYLLIGFWFKRESAIQGSLKAFIANRVGDFGFLMGIAVIFAFAGSLDYVTVFKQGHQLAQQHIEIFNQTPWSVVSVICVLLFLGAMGKSAQMPLHIWLPESMEGPTPISALIHAATMVTAGVFMVARMSPLFEYSVPALSMVIVLGATGALFLGLLAVVQNDIKRVVAYSTLSQLGYMMVAQGASAYSAGIFHLLTHACFKAALFLAAGAVIIAMHHEHDMRKMGNLKKYMPLTWITFLISSLSQCGVPPFSGFFSKDAIIEAAHLSTIPGAQYAYWCVTIGVFVTALYTFRSYFMTFHTKEKMDEKTRAQLKEAPWQITVPLVLLAIPAVILGGLIVEPMLFAKPTLLGSALFILPTHDVVAKLGGEFQGIGSVLVDALFHPAFWLAWLGILTAYVCYVRVPEIPQRVATRFSVFYRILVNKYGFDEFNQWAFVRGSRGLGNAFFQVGDRALIDGVGVNGTANSVRRFSGLARLMQSGFLFHYTLAMVLGLLVFLSLLILG